MPKKIYDIKPPKVAYKLESAIKDIKKGSTKKRRKTTPNPIPSKKEKRSFPLKEVLIGVLAIVFLFFIYLFFILPKAEVKVWPVVEDLVLSKTITIDKSFNEVDFAGSVIPAIYVQEEKSLSKVFEATGISEKEGKASGFITIFNKIDSLTPLTLIKGTHFLSDSGRYFITLGKVTIPSAKYEKGKLVPGSLNVKIEAKEAGDGSNIGASNFSIPKLSGTSYYYAVFAESNSPMSGGYKGTVKKVTADDINLAKKVLTEELLGQAQLSLRKKISENDILLEDAVLKDIISAEFDVKEGAISDKFEGQAKLRLWALAFKKRDIEEFIKDNALLQLPSSKRILDSSPEINYSVKEIDFEKGKATIDVQSSVKNYYSINTNKVVDFLASKSADQVKEAFYHEYGNKISEVKIDFWPFWANKTPRNKNKIKINLIFH